MLFATERADASMILNAAFDDHYARVAPRERRVFKTPRVRRVVLIFLHCSLYRVLHYNRFIAD